MSTTETLFRRIRRTLDVKDVEKIPDSELQSLVEPIEAYAALPIKTTAHLEILDTLAVKLWNASGPLFIADSDASSSTGSSTSFERIATMRRIAALLIRLTTPTPPSDADGTRLLSVLSKAADALIRAWSSTTALTSTEVKRMDEAASLLHHAADVRCRWRLALTARRSLERPISTSARSAQRATTRSGRQRRRATSSADWQSCVRVS